MNVDVIMPPCEKDVKQGIQAHLLSNKGERQITCTHIEGPVWVDLRSTLEDGAKHYGVNLEVTSIVRRGIRRRFDFTVSGDPTWVSLFLRCIALAVKMYNQMCTF